MHLTPQDRQLAAGIAAAHPIQARPAVAARSHLFASNDTRLSGETDEAKRARTVEVLQTALSLAAQHDLNAPAWFSPTKVRRPFTDERVQPTVAEVLVKALDSVQFQQRLVAVLVATAAGRGSQREALLLLGEAIAAWADEQADFVA